MEPSASASLIPGATAAPSDPQSAISRQPFGKTADDTAVELFTLKNSRGMEARITNYGGIVVSLKVPDRRGRLDDVVLGYDNLQGYLRKNPFFGCLVGRCGNRIAGGAFTLDGKKHTLALNNPPNHIHGGFHGFDKAVWQARTLQRRTGPALELRHLSKDGEEGYPGNLAVTALYTLTHQNELRLDFTAATDQPTICNLTHHSYFNLAGQGDILEHEVMIPAACFTPVDATLIPTGELRPVADTPFDFRQPIRIGARINQDDPQLKLTGGYDHNWVFDKPPGKLALIARVSEPTTGRVLEAFSTEPGMQFYTGNFLDGTISGKGGRVYQRRHGFCLEPQHFPDSPNQPHFPSVTLRPGAKYKNTIAYRFSTDQDSRPIEGRK